MGNGSESIVTFAEGLVGFADRQQFALLPGRSDDSPFSLLRAVDGDGDLTFVVVQPAVFFPDYDPEIDDETIDALGLPSAEDALVLVIVTVPDDVQGATANLLGPLVVNRATLQGRQAVLSPERWPSRRPLVSA